MMKSCELQFCRKCTKFCKSDKSMVDRWCMICDYQVMGPTAKPPVLFPVQKTGRETETGATTSAKREEIGLMLKNSAKEQEGILLQ